LSKIICHFRISSKTFFSLISQLAEKKTYLRKDISVHLFSQLTTLLI